MSTALSNSRLFKPLEVGGRTLSSRLVMAPMTRYRSDDQHVPLPMVKEYYVQRASVPGTMLITEATLISPQGGSFANAPGIWSDDQVCAWKDIVKGVHDAGGHIWLQLWGLGRAADPQLREAEGSGQLISSSAVSMNDDSRVPREMSEEEIRSIIKDYASAASRAVHEAGFDGVELHAANGYLIDQFTQDTCNRRSDSWGGSVEKRARFAIEVTEAVIKAVGSKNVGIRLSPWSHFQGMRMEDPVPQFRYLVKELNKSGLAYLHMVESRIAGAADVESDESLSPFIDEWDKDVPLVLAGGFTVDSALQEVDVEHKDRAVVIAFGRHFLSSPDLPFRLRSGIAPSKYKRDTFYTPCSRDGYTDYGFSDQWRGRASA